MMEAPERPANSMASRTVKRLKVHAWGPMNVPATERSLGMPEIVSAARDGETTKGAAAARAALRRKWRRGREEFRMRAAVT